MSTVDEAEVKRRWAAPGFSCDLWVNAPGRVWKDFVHEADELAMLVEGAEEFEMSGQKQSPTDRRGVSRSVPQLADNGQPQWQFLDNNSGQDIAAWMTLGPIADRSTEALGRSDRGIILYRQLLEEQVGIIESGRDPMNVFRDPTKNVYLHTDFSSRPAPAPRTGRK